MRRLLSAFLFLSLFASSMAGCAAEVDPVGPSHEALTVDVIDIDYDDVAAGINPCVVVPSGTYTAVETGEADFLVDFEATYETGGTPVTVQTTALLSELTATGGDASYTTVELFVAGPRPDDIASGITPCCTIEPLGGVTIIQDPKHDPVP